MEISNLRWWCHLKVNACSMTSRLRQQKRISLWFFLFPQRVQLMLSASGQRSKLQQEGGGLTLSCGQRWFSFSKCVKVRKRWQNSCLTAVLKPRGRDWRRGGAWAQRWGRGGAGACGEFSFWCKNMCGNCWSRQSQAWSCQQSAASPLCKIKQDGGIEFYVPE